MQPPGMFSQAKTATFVIRSGTPRSFQAKMWTPGIHCSSSCQITSRALPATSRLPIPWPAVNEGTLDSAHNRGELAGIADRQRHAIWLDCN